MDGWRIAWFFSLTISAAAQPTLHFKPERGRIIAAGDPDLFAGIHHIGRNRHIIVQFDRPATEIQLRGLENRGARIVEYVPDFGYVLSVADWMQWRELAASESHIRGTGIRQPQQKLSASLTTAPTEDTFALAEFYPDVDMGLARTIVLLAHLQIQENPSLLEHHLLVHGSAEAFAILAGWDEVSYIFPASDDLVRGLPMNGCAGALSSAGYMGQSISTVSSGWGGPGLNAAALFYAFQSVTEKIPADAARSEIARAFNEWAKYVQVSFTPSSDIGGNRTISVLFASRAHGDAYPFDGSGGVLAHTFYPTPANPEPIAGDMHFDLDENWQMGSSIDLFSAALHETGHALGLGHSDRANAVMYPYYKAVSGLTPEDITAVLTLYAAQTGARLTLTIQDPGATTTASMIALSGSVSGGSGSVTVTWSANGFSGTAGGVPSWSIPVIPLNSGANTIVVTATDSQSNSVAQSVSIARQQTATPPASAPSIAITSPAAGGTYYAASASVTLSGTASDSSGISKVTWTSPPDAGTATGTGNWSTGPMVLSSGSNTITVTAYAQSGTKSSQTLQAIYTPAATPTPDTPVAPPSYPSGTAAPSLTILSPSNTTVSTSASSITFSGTSKDNSGVAAVTWNTSNGDSGTALGTENWNASIPLLVGANTVTIVAKDNAGLTSWRSAVVTRR